MDNLEIKQHPKLGILVRSDGCILRPASGVHPESWTYGRVRNKKGYLSVKIRNHEYSIHRLVAEAFIPNNNNLPQIDHINRIVTDNRASNLRWANQSMQSRNRSIHDKLSLQGATHRYEDAKVYAFQKQVRYRVKMQKNGFVLMHFSNGTHWVKSEIASKLRNKSIKDRVYPM